MTTLVGIKSQNGKESVVLGSDMSRTQTSWQPQGDVAYRHQRRIEGQKIYINDKRNAAICMSGIFDNPYINFLSDFLESKFDLEKITKEGGFDELLKLNLSRWEGRTPSGDLYNGLLLATNFENPKLYSCWPLGKVEEKSYTSIGSGSDYALKYISEQSKIIPRRISLEETVDLAIGSLENASQDIYTGGLDLVVVTKNEIYSFGENIKQNLDSAKEKSIEQIKKSLQSSKKSTN